MHHMQDAFSQARLCGDVDPYVAYMMVYGHMMTHKHVDANVGRHDDALTFVNVDVDAVSDGTETWLEGAPPVAYMRRQCDAFTLLERTLGVTSAHGKVLRWLARVGHTGRTASASANTASSSHGKRVFLHDMSVPQTYGRRRQEEGRALQVGRVELGVDGRRRLRRRTRAAMRLGRVDADPHQFHI